MTADQVWIGLIGSVMGRGSVAMPGGKLTRELLSNQTVTDMKFPILQNTIRKINRRFMYAEAAWILRGDNRASALEPYIKSYGKYAESDSDRIQWAYGPKVIEQLHYCCETLIKDCDSRQSVMSLWRECPRYTPPCTLTLQFLIRGTHLHAVVSMRSSDVWLGWPYDVFSFSMIAAYLGLMMKSKYELTPGSLYLTAGSQHIYTEHYNRSYACIDNLGDNGENTPFDYTQFNTPDDLLNYLEAMRNEV